VEKSFTFHTKRKKELRERRREKFSFFILKQLEMFPHFLPVLFKENFHLRETEKFAREQNFCNLRVGTVVRREKRESERNENLL
jgi:hypothetical protein